jgi:hypothetical protein
MRLDCSASSLMLSCLSHSASPRADVPRRIAISPFLCAARYRLRYWSMGTCRLLAIQYSCTCRRPGQVR